MLIQHPDPTVAHVATWAPRMIVQGIDYNDLVTTAARMPAGYLGTIGAASGA